MPTSFFAKTLRRAVLRVRLGAYPGVFVKWWATFLGVVLVSFLTFVHGLVCVFLFVFVYGYAVNGLVMCWLCVGKRLTLSIVSRMLDGC